MNQDGLVTHAEPVMGTVVSFALHPGELPGPDLRAALNAACAVLQDADGVFSTWDPGSPLSLLRRGAPRTAPPPVMAEVEAACRQARDASGGWFDPWAMPGGYDPTGLVKGWAVHNALRTLDQAGIPAALVNGGGDLAAFGMPGPGRCWRAGIRHPWRASGLAAVIEVHGAVATSASYERGAHLMDPRTGQPGGQAASATVDRAQPGPGGRAGHRPGGGRGRRAGGDQRAGRLPGVPDPPGRQRVVDPGDGVRQRLSWARRPGMPADGIWLWVEIS